MTGVIFGYTRCCWGGREVSILGDRIFGVELAKHLDRERKMSEWRDFKDRPNESCRVLWLYKVEHPKSWVYACASGRWHKASDGGMAYQEDFEGDPDYGRPTHWMPLPPPPKGNHEGAA